LPPTLSLPPPLSRVGLGDKDRAPVPQAVVKPQVLTHLIEGFVIQEGAEPFPVSTTSAAANTLNPAEAERARPRPHLLPPPRAPSNAEAPPAGAAPVTLPTRSPAGTNWSSVTRSPVAPRTCPLTEKRRMTLPRCPRVLRSPARKPGRMLPPTARRLVTESKGPTSSRRLLLSGAWKKSAGSSPRFKASERVRRLLPGSPSGSHLPASVLRLRRAGGSVPVAGNRRTGSAAAAGGPPHLHHEHQTGPRPQDLRLHQHFT
ncbi:unnamed protein product, partial [Tetraodon nigroviridis]